MDTIYSSNNKNVNKRFFISGLSCLSIFPSVAWSLDAHQGRFIGKVVAEWLIDGRTMRLVQPFEFIDKNNRRWPVPLGVVIDGASIPKIFWSLIGGPFEGLYREASVIHDYFCSIRTRPSVDVHEVFYDAMISSGVSKSMAYLMFKAVVVFGPRWNDPKLDPRCQIDAENYDYELCSQNSLRPTVEQPIIDKAKLTIFANSLEGQIEDKDLELLRKTISTIN